MKRFEQLLAEGESEPTEGWDFSWFEGRATESRPSWGYARLLSQRMAVATVALDVQTGGGEVLAIIENPPRHLVATESWPPNIGVANVNLRGLGARVVGVGNAYLPFRSNTFDLVTSRHPVTTPWQDISRVLRPGGTFLSQQVGAGSNRELTTFFVGAHEVGEARRPEHHVQQAEANGLTVVDLQAESLAVEFFDVGAVVYFLRKVLWTVPGFSTTRYLERLRAMHDLIEQNGSFTSHAERFLIEAYKTD